MQRKVYKNYNYCGRIAFSKNVETIYILVLSRHSLLPILSFARSIMSDNRMRFQIRLQRYWHIYIIKIEYLLKVKDYSAL